MPEGFAVEPVGLSVGPLGQQESECFRVPEVLRTPVLAQNDSCFHRVRVESVPPDSDQEVEVGEVAQSRPPPYLWRV